MPHDVIRAPGHVRKRSLGWLAVRWMNQFCLHGPGDIQGKTLAEIPLSDELVTLTVDSYALDEDGRRLYDSVFYSRPKGANKSGQGSWFACFEALGPCRFAGWAKGGETYEWMDFKHVYKAGEPMGRPVTYPFLRIMATEEGQSGNVYDGVYYNLKEGPLREAFPKKDDVGLTRVFLPDGGEIAPSTASSASKDGGKETWSSFDETHLYSTPVLRGMFRTVKRNMAKRKDAEPWGYEPSTMYAVGMESVAEMSHQLAQRIREGKEKFPRLLFDHRCAPAGLNPENEDDVRRGLREAYGVDDGGATYMDFARLMSEWFDPRNEIGDNVRYFWNRAEARSGAALNVDAWRRNTRESRPPQEGIITIGFDGSISDDATAMIATHVESGIQWPLGIWEADDMNEGWRRDVDAVLEEAWGMYDVWRLQADPWKWETILAQWAGRYGAKKIVAFPTNQYNRMAPAVKAYATAINAGECLNNGDPVHARHIANAVKLPVTVKDDDGRPLFVFQKDAVNSKRKKDAAEAGVLSWDARLKAIEAGVLERPKWSGIFIRDDEDDE